MDLTKIKQLREKTGAGIADCNAALKEVDGDIKKAEELLKKQGFEKAAKKANRAIASGLIESYIHGQGKIGVLVEIGCETDFVARTDDFKHLAHEVAMQISAMNPKDVKTLLSQEYIRDSSLTIEQLIKAAIAKLGENISIIKFSRMVLGE